MDKSGWNWEGRRTFLHSFSGILTGRYTKRSHQPDNPGAAQPIINSHQRGWVSRGGVHAALVNRFEQFANTHPNMDEVMTNAIFLGMSVCVQWSKRAWVRI